MLRSSLRFALLLGLTGAAPAVSAQTTPPAAAQTAPASRPTRPGADQLPLTTYTYRSFVIYDISAGPKPVPAQGVGGTLTLHPDGSYEKHLQLRNNQGPMQFDQRGRFTLSGPDSIRFEYTNGQGQPKTDRGRYRLDAKKRTVELTIKGFPAGNRGVYQLALPPR
ncbi:hypothetical protein EJV47_14975 [Hymenobacter gummosus]|uniref:Uncharacterized protein n=1 Tax=Hymenobacter gummosus TaxID=1776032 RepID=A0A3S0QHA5_9BACT|nr:hypothetical protein [Hymenobacter gummosus]RTQ48896.1 hypothetical protein EJV47_14975 [Hymenobacter gummosus]